MALYQDVIIAGFGGQGVLLIGNLLAYSVMQTGLYVTYMPVYGVEQRGGTANCTVVISQEEIGSPLVMHPTSLIIMNQPSLEKFQPRLQDSGLQVVNTSIVEGSLLEGERIRSFRVPANDLAIEMGNPRMANRVALGAWLEASGIVEIERVMDCFPLVLGKDDERLVRANYRAMQAGAEEVRKVLQESN